MTAAGRRARSRGVTLVEMLVALALLGMMATLALGGLRLGVRTWDTVGRRAEAESRGQIIRSFLRRTLSQALIATRVDADGKPQTAFVGDAESLSLVAPLASHLGLGGPQSIRLSVEEADEPGKGRRLVLTRTLFYPRGIETESGEAERHVLLEGLVQARFAYLRVSEGGAREWVGEWSDESTLPLLLRLTIERQGNGSPWPDLVVPFRITAASGAT